PVPCLFRLLVCCGAGAVIATALNVFAVRAQTATDPSGLLRPAFDGERSTLQRFGQAERLTRPNTLTRPGATPADPNAPRAPRAGRAGEGQGGGRPPAFGAGATGFDSTKARRRRARTPAPARPAAKTTPVQPPLLLTPPSLSPPAFGGAQRSGSA